MAQCFISGSFLLFKYSLEDYFYLFKKKMVSSTDHSPLGNQAPSKQYTKNQSTSHNIALVYHPTTSQEKHKTHFYIET